MVATSGTRRRAAATGRFYGPAGCLDIESGGGVHRVFVWRIINANDTNIESVYNHAAGLIGTELWPAANSYSDGFAVRESKTILGCRHARGLLLNFATRAVFVNSLPGNNCHSLSDHVNEPVTWLSGGNCHRRQDGLKLVYLWRVHSITLSNVIFTYHFAFLL